MSILTTCSKLFQRRALDEYSYGDGYRMRMPSYLQAPVELDVHRDRQFLHSLC